MKRPFSGIDLHFLIQELDIENSKIEKIYQFDKREFIIRLYTQNGKKHLRINLDGMVHLTQKKYEGPKMPTGYVVFLRKYLTNTRITKIKQVGLERILIFEIESKTEKYELIFELFNPGNIILTKENIIMHPLERQSFKTREIKSKIEYVLPPKQLSVFDITKEEFEETIKDTKDTLGKFVATQLGFGGMYSEDFIQKNNLNKESNPQKNKNLYEQIKDYLTQKIDAYTDKENAYPIKIQELKELEKKETFSQALDTFFKIKEKKEQQLKENKKSKFEVVIQSQKKRAQKLEEQANEAQKKGEYIYEKYTAFKTLLDTINEMKKNKSLDEIELELKKYDFFKKIDKKNKTIELEFK